jgi:tetratricopeptide (TPR) repeat protein
MENKELGDINLKGKTVTFYSYKGGVGRSMSLVNIACLMVKQGKKVLLIDWDLEAPGLHSFFNDSIKKDALGLVDFITDATTFIKEEANNNDEGYFKFLNENIHNYIQKDISIEKSELKLDIIKAGKFDENYTNKLNEIDWISFYKNAPSFFRTFAEFLEVQYDYILIDSRTGLSDTGGVCTMLMPQILVLVFALNNQNLNGVIDVARQSVNYRFDSNDSRDLTILPLPSRIDNQNSTELEIWIQNYTEKFQNLFKELYLLDDCALENYFNIAKIPYKPTHAYGENIPVLIENVNNDLFISYHYAQFYKLLEEETAIWEILSREQLENNKLQSANHFQKGIDYSNNKEYEMAILEFQKSWELDLKNYFAVYNSGYLIHQLAKLENKESLYLESIEIYEKAIALNPKYESALMNCGHAIYELAILKHDATLYEQSIKKFEQIIALNPKSYFAFNNWGVTIKQLAKLKNDTRLYEQCIEKYKQSILLNPTYYHAFENWGNAIKELALITNDEKLFSESFEKINKAIELGAGSYNLACLYAVRNDKLKALSTLKICLENNEQNVTFIKNDEDWKPFLEDFDFIALLEKHK